MSKKLKARSRRGEKSINVVVQAKQYPMLDDAVKSHSVFHRWTPSTQIG